MQLNRYKFYNKIFKFMASLPRFVFITFINFTKCLSRYSSTRRERNRQCRFSTVDHGRSCASSEVHFSWSRDTMFARRGEKDTRSSRRAAGDKGEGEGCDGCGAQHDTQTQTASDPPTLPYSVSMSLPLSEFVWVLHLYGCGTCTVNGYYVSRRLYSLVQAASGCCCLCSPLHPIL